MSDRRHPEHYGSTREWAEQTQRLQQPRRPYADPAYSGQPSYPPPYRSGPGYDPNAANPTDKLPHYWTQGQPSGHGPHEPEPDKPKAPKWLWIAAGAAVLLVVALVIALVLADGTARKQTAVPALPSTPSSASSAPTRSPSASAPAPAPSGTQPADPGSMQAVVYNVSGEGRAISITYVDNDGMMQTEFNVALPWIKDVSLPESGRAPNVTIVNIGHDVTCSVTVDGVEITHRSGAGLTICNGNG